MKIKLSKSSAKFLSNLGDKKFARQIALQINKLAANGHMQDSKKLKGNLSPYYRSDIGEYRIIYRIENSELLIPLIGKRNDGEIYKLMERKKL